MHSAETMNFVILFALNPETMTAANSGILFVVDPVTIATANTGIPLESGARAQSLAQVVE